MYSQSITGSTKKLAKPSMQRVDEIRDYIISQSRNKIVIHESDITTIDPVNVGQRLSQAISNFKGTRKSPTGVMMELEKVLDASIAQHDAYGRYLSIENLGILFEPELKIDFSRLLDKYSQNNVLFVKWDGEIDSNNIYFLSKENGIQTNLKNLSHLVI